MIMRRSRFSPFGTFVAAIAFLLTVLPLAAAPVLAGTKTALPHDMAMSGMSAGSDGPCADMAKRADRSPGNHVQTCLALCLVAHGAVLPQLPNFIAAWHSPAALPDAAITCDLHADASGIDPPPPRQA